MAAEATQIQGMLGSERARQLVMNRWLVADKSQSKQTNRFYTFMDMYKNKRVGANYRGLSDIVVPKVFEKVERGTAIISQAIKRIRVTGQGTNDQESAKRNEKLIDYEDRVLNIPRKRKMWIKHARVYGTSYLKATWNIATEEPNKPYKGLDISVIDPKHLRFNPDHVLEQPFRWVIHEMLVPFSELKKNKLYQNMDQVKAKSELGGKRSLTAKSAGTKKALDITDETTLMVNIKEYFGPFNDSDAKEEKDYHIILANDSDIIWMKPNAYSLVLDDPIPIFPLYLYQGPDEQFGIGDAEAIQSLYTELNDTRNQRMDAVTQIIDPPKVVLKAANISEEDLIAKRGWVIRSNIQGGYSVVPPDVQGIVAAIQEEKIIQGDIDRTLGIPSFGAQTPVSGDITTDTATGVNATLQAQDVISNSILEEVKYSLQKFYRAILAYNQYFIDRQFVISVVDEQTSQPVEEQIDPSRIAGNMDLDIEVELVGNRLARRAEALQALTVGSKIPGTNMGKLWEDYLKTHDKYNFEEYYTPPQPSPPEPPKISVSLKGDLTQLQSSQVYTQIPGVKAIYADPIMIPEGRDMLLGNLPEHKESDDKDFERNMRIKELNQKSNGR